MKDIATNEPICPGSGLIFNRHTMVRSTHAMGVYAYGWDCDGCGAFCESSTARWHCGSCASVQSRGNLDYCFACIPDTTCAPCAELPDTDMTDIAPANVTSTSSFSALLAMYEFEEHQIAGDGNCQFRSLSHQLYDSDAHHQMVREQVCEYIAAHYSSYVGFLAGILGQDAGHSELFTYVTSMRVPCVNAADLQWGDNLTLQAAADAFDVDVTLLASIPGRPDREVLSRNGNDTGSGSGTSSRGSRRMLWLSYSGSHYNSLTPATAGGVIGVAPATVPSNANVSKAQHAAPAATTQAAGITFNTPYASSYTPPATATATTRDISFGTNGSYSNGYSTNSSYNSSNSHSYSTRDEYPSRGSSTAMHDVHTHARGRARGSALHIMSGSGGAFSRSGVKQLVIR